MGHWSRSQLHPGLSLSHRGCLPPCSIVRDQVPTVLTHLSFCFSRQADNNLKRCQEEADEVKVIMLDNFTKVMDREGKLSDLDERAEELRNQVPGCGVVSFAGSASCRGCVLLGRGCSLTTQPALPANESLAT